MSFSDTVFLFFMALILFGPKKLPEMARKAGKLMAELRRASNEFRSQIETEIAHLEVEKTNSAPPAAPLQGTVASLSLNPVSAQLAPHESSGTLAGPTSETASPAATISRTEAIVPAEPNPPTEPVSESAASQESHV
jgi:sec-independent protein translocase protein TatB